MSAVSELYAMRRSFSGDAVRGIQSRSGDDQDGGAPLFDYVAHVQSAESDIIESEEREEQAESKQEFARLLRLYFKKILSDQERKFLTECLRSGKTPHKIGRAMGLDYRAVIESVQHKHEKNAPRLAALMRAVGYDYRRGLEFLPSLRRYMYDINRMREYYNNRGGREKKQEYKAAHLEQIRVKDLRYREAHRDEINARARAYRNAHRDEKNAKCRAYYEEHREELKAAMRSRSAAHYKEHREEILARQRERYAQKKAEIQAKHKAYYEEHRDEINARRYGAKYYAEHREEILARQRERYARKKAQKESAASE